MNPHPILLLTVSLLLTACNDKRDKSNTPAQETRTRKKPERIASQPDPDPRKKLRTDFIAARKLFDPQERDAAVAEIAWNALELDPELAKEAFQQLAADSREKLQLIQHFALLLAESDPDEAITWAATAGTEREIAAAFGKVALVISDTDPGRAAQLLSESGIAGGEFDRTVVEVLNRWATKEPADATAWVILFPAGRAREAGLETTVTEWLEADLAGVFSWVDSIQDHALHHELCSTLAKLMAEQPKQILEDSLRHADPKTRTAVDEQLRLIPPPGESLNRDD